MRGLLHHLFCFFHYHDTFKWVEYWGGLPTFEHKVCTDCGRHWERSWGHKSLPWSEVVGV